jgi:hypothetical protein
MPTVIAYHDVKDKDHWLSSSTREEFFGPLGVTSIRTFVDPTNPTRVGMTPANKPLESELADLVGRVHDRQVKKLCGQLLTEYRAVFAAAPKPTGGRVYVMDARPDPPEYAEQDRLRSEAIARQHDNATVALSTVEAILAKLNKLEFFVTT